MSTRIRDLIEEERFEMEVERRAWSNQKGHGLKPKGAVEREYATCPHCDRATVLVEHVFTPQLKIFPEEQREETYYTCDWCGSEVELTNTRMPRKPAGSAGETEMERARRRA